MEQGWMKATKVIGRADQRVHASSAASLLASMGSFALKDVPSAGSGSNGRDEFRATPPTYQDSVHVCW